VSTLERVVSRIASCPEAGCWLWGGYLKPDGYGRVRLHGTKWLAHRAVYELMVGPIPEGVQVCHSCDNPSCVRPDHMFLGSQRDNVQDCIKKGRFRGWENSPWI